MPSSSQHPATLVTSPHKAADPKDAVMGIVYSAWKALHEAEPLDLAMDFEFLIRELLSALHDLCTFSDVVSQTRYTQFCHKAQAHLDAFVQPSWLLWCEELILPERAAAFSASKDLSPPPVTEASAYMPSDTGKVMASDSLTASTSTDDAFLSVALASSSVVAAPVMAPAAIGIPVPKFEFQACATNPVAINPPSDSDAVAMKVDPPLATVVAESPSAQGSEVIEVSSNDEDDSDSDEVEFMSRNLLNLSPVHSKKGKGHSRKSTKASKMTTNSEDQYVRMPVHTFCDRSLPPEYLLAWQKLSIACLKLYHQKDWPLPKMPDAKVIMKASSHQGDYDEQMRDANTASSDYAMKLELPLDTPIDEYETVIALAPHLHRPPLFQFRSWLTDLPPGPVHTLPDTPEPNAESDAEGTSEIVTVKQEKGTAGPSHHKPLKCPHFNDSDPDNIMMQHAHVSTIVVPSTKVLKPHSSKGKAHAKGSFKAATMKSEPFSSSPATIEPSETSTQLEWMIELLQQLHKKNQALRAHK
ncbi:uncharacterized protein LAESUDRAFT_765143 [Laetiporus sulphureus 93-53]|uniref:Uncharacterized protein n=1 Tax=Laetiporus sulphureus 93-53 TaxID=1314785 RepID=A0A165AXZ8_9APHY|nr:uncharacterized protein LAESUDRAFT_765143 [Laetiporus sulphureus 93-53]KZS99871.1 hypothetical protein LAESUDRAFT_765143 [Laetiporus sulphureus 93-53]